jgi:hypothetical protein
MKDLEIKQTIFWTDGYLKRPYVNDGKSCTSKSILFVHNSELHLGYFHSNGCYYSTREPGTFRPDFVTHWVYIEDIEDWFLAFTRITSPVKFKDMIKEEA